MGEGAIGFALPLSLELSGIFVVLIGVAVEISTGAPIGYNLISVGSLLIAAGSLIWGKLMRKRKERPQGDDG
ncbi:MAG: hypothetical protein ACE5Z5_05735 [Candidatus Bathyarchaeia archaeon]